MTAPHASAPRGRITQVCHGHVRVAMSLPFNPNPSPMDPLRLRPRAESHPLNPHPHLSPQPGPPPTTSTTNPSHSSASPASSPTTMRTYALGFIEPAQHHIYAIDVNGEAALASPPSRPRNSTPGQRPPPSPTSSSSPRPTPSRHSIPETGSRRRGRDPAPRHRRQRLTPHRQRPRLHHHLQALRHGPPRLCRPLHRATRIWQTPIGKAASGSTPAHRDGDHLPRHRRRNASSPSTPSRVPHPDPLWTTDNPEPHRLLRRTLPSPTSAIYAASYDFDAGQLNSNLLKLDREGNVLWSTPMRALRLDAHTRSTTASTSPPAFMDSARSPASRPSPTTPTTPPSTGTPHSTPGSTPMTTA